MALELPETFRYEKRGHVAIMTINRPRAMNAFTGEMLAAMDACFADFRKDDDLWVAILTGARREGLLRRHGPAGGDPAAAMPARSWATRTTPSVRSPTCSSRSSRP